MAAAGSQPRKPNKNLSYLYTERKSQYFDVAALEQRNSTWIQDNINRRECVRFVPNNDDDDNDGSEICKCGLEKSKHTNSTLQGHRANGQRSNDEDEETESKPNRDNGTKWSIEEDTKCMKTNAFGEVEFVGPGSGFAQKPRKYIRLDYQTDPRVLLTLVSTIWKLGAPKLLISVMGGAKNFKLSERLRDIFCKGLMEAAVSTGAWIISAGTHTGAMKYVGEAVRDYQQAYRYEDVVAIGISTWGALTQQQEFIRKQPTAKLSTQKHNDKQGVYLDPNHTHFILVDDGTSERFGAGLDLRVKLEEMISTKVKVGSESSTNVPVVCVILEGGANTIRKAHNAVTHGTPIVVVADSGRAADILALAIKHSQYVDDDENSKKMTEALRAQVGSMLQKIFPEGIAVPLQLVEECLMEPHLLNVYEESSGVAVDVVILNALMKGNHRKQQDYLRLAQAWNRIDIARTDLLDASSKDFEMKQADMDELFRDALIHNRVDFVKLYLESGFSLKDYLTYSELKHLYNQVKHGTVLYSLLAKMRSHSKEKHRQFTLVDVGKVIQSLIIDRYKAPYQDLEHDGRNQWNGTNETEQHKHDDPQKPGSPCLQDPIRELFLYAVLNKFDDMARFFWEEGKETMAAALVASKMYQHMSVRLTARDAELKEQLKLLSRTYSKLAISVLNECNKDDEQWASILLLKELPHWGMVTCISLADKNRHFISHVGVQDLIKEIWYGQLDSEANSSMALWICTAIPFLIPFVATYSADESTIVARPHAHVLSPSKRYSNAGYIEDDVYEMHEKGKNKRDSKAKRSRSTSRIPPPKVEEDGSLREPGADIFTIWQKILFFYNSPMIKFRHNVISHLIFLGLFSFIMLSDHFTSIEPPWYEYLLIIWVGTFLFEEFRQIAQGDPQKWRLRVKEWLSDYWNQLDVSTIILFATGMVLRFYSGALDAARVVLAFDLFIFYMRLLNCLTIYKNLGPKLIMIGKMFVDVLFFLCILFVFLIAYGITVQAILYPSITDIQGLIYGVLYKPYFQVYGDLFLDDIRATPEDGTCTTNTTLSSPSLPICPEYSGIGIFLLAIYMIFSNVLMLNLLIAMFSFTFTSVQERTDMYWKYQQFALAKEYYNKPPLIPPLIIFSHIAFAIRFILHKSGCCYRWNIKTLTKHLEHRDAKQLLHWESIQAYKIISKMKLKQSNLTDTLEDGSGDGTSSEGEKILLQSLNDQQKSISSRLHMLEDQVGQCNAALNWVVNAIKNQETCKLKSDLQNVCENQ